MSNLVFGKEVNVTQDIVIGILKRRFPECSVQVQTWGIGAPWVYVRKNCFVRVIVRIKKNKETGNTEIATSTWMDGLAYYFFGFIVHYILRGDIEDEVRSALEKDLRNNNTSDDTRLSAPPPHYSANSEDTVATSGGEQKLFAHPFSFNGRIRRKEYNLSLLFYYLYCILIGYLVGRHSLIALVLYIPAYWFLFAQNAKRCHDLGHNGWWQLIPFYIFWLIFQNSQEGVNEYGANPKNE